MANLMNSCNFTGRMARDPKVQTIKTQKGDMTKVFFTLAVNRPYNKNAQQQIADFINFSAIGVTADFIVKHFPKGKPMMVNASYETYKTNQKDPNGYDVMGHIFTVNEVAFTVSDSNGGNGGNAGGNTAKPQSNRATAPDFGFDSTFEVDDDDLPF